MPSGSEQVPSTVADLAALGQLWEEHRERLLATVERRIDPRLRQRIDPSEVLNEAFLDASRRWASYQQGSPMQPYPWLYRITLDRYVEIYRRNVADGRDLRRDMPWTDDCSAVLGAHLMDAGTGPLTAAQRAELAEQIHRVLGLLPEPDHDVLAMRYFDQLSTREICDVLNAPRPDRPLSEDAVNVRMFRALKKLQKLWQQTFGDHS